MKKENLSKSGAGTIELTCGKKFKLSSASYRIQILAHNGS